MAQQKTCSSSSSSTQTCTYEVFVSFFGEDTRFSFTDHLFAALKRNGIRTFRDDTELERGKAIWTELEKAIETSRIAVIVFSKNYAASSWCLDELAKIMECNRSLKQIVLPVFYKVNPSDVRNQKGSFEKAFDRYKGVREGKVARWRAALNKAASLSGLPLARRSEAELIEKIIGEIFKKLNGGGIWGIVGIRKTTIAKAIYYYNQLQRKFQGSHFFEAVREIAKPKTHHHAEIGKPKTHHHAKIGRPKSRSANPRPDRRKPTPRSAQTHAGRLTSTHTQIGANPRWKAEIKGEHKEENEKKWKRERNRANERERKK